MAVTETAKCKLYVKLVEVLGQENADTLWELLMQRQPTRTTEIDDLRRRVEILEQERHLVRC